MPGRVRLLMRAGRLIVVTVLAATSAVGLWRRSTDGKMRTVPEPLEAFAAPLLTTAEIGAELGGKATFVQFSTAFCSPCRTTRLLLGQIAVELDGVVHAEIDAEKHLDLVRRLGISRTPTVLVLDATGRIVRRATGVPRRQDALAAVALAVSGPRSADPPSSP